MTVIRLLVDPSWIEGDRATIRGDELRYLGRVRRARVGEAVELIDGAGRVLRGSVGAIDRGSASIRDLAPVDTPSYAPVTLGLGLGRVEALDRAVRGACELGVDVIAALRTDRSLGRGGVRGRSTAARWRRIAREALRSSGRGRAAEVIGPLDLGEWLDSAAAPSSTRLLLDAGGVPMAVATAQRRQTDAAAARRWVLLVGPEGGWTPRERDLAAAHGFALVSIGPANLRVEVAVVAAVAVLRACAQ